MLGFSCQYIVYNISAIAKKQLNASSPILPEIRKKPGYAATNKVIIGTVFLGISMALHNLGVMNNTPQEARQGANFPALIMTNELHSLRKGHVSLLPKADAK